MVFRFLERYDHLQLARCSHRLYTIGRHRESRHSSLRVSWFYSEKKWQNLYDCLQYQPHVENLYLSDMGRCIWSPAQPITVELLLSRLPLASLQTLRIETKGFLDISDKSWSTVLVPWMIHLRVPRFGVELYSTSSLLPLLHPLLCISDCSHLTDLDIRVLSSTDFLPFPTTLVTLRLSLACHLDLASAGWTHVTHDLYNLHHLEIIGDMPNRETLTWSYDDWHSLCRASFRLHTFTLEGRLVFSPPPPPKKRFPVLMSVERLKLVRYGGEGYRLEPWSSSEWDRMALLCPRLQQLDVEFSLVPHTSFHTLYLPWTLLDSLHIHYPSSIVKDSERTSIEKGEEEEEKVQKKEKEQERVQERIRIYSIRHLVLEYTDSITPLSLFQPLIHIQGVQHLTLYACRVEETLLAAIAQYFPELQCLEIDPSVSQPCLMSQVKAREIRRFTSLRTLILSASHIWNDSILIGLSEGAPPTLQQLHTIDLPDVTSEGWNQVLKRLSPRLRYWEIDGDIRDTMVEWIRRLRDEGCVVTL